VQSPDTRLPTLEGLLEENVPGADALNQLGSLASFVTDKENWKRVGLFVGGGIAIIVGVMLWAKESPTVRQAAGTAVTVATRGKL
jgi:hypothetical protein